MERRLRIRETYWPRTKELDGLGSANGFDIFAAAVRAQGPDAWEGYFEVKQVLTQRIQDVVRLQ